MTDSADYEAAKRKLLQTGPMEPDMLDVLTQLQEQKQVNSALIKMAAYQQLEADRMRERIVDLIKSNNAFEERARKAEREVARLRGYGPLVDPA